MINQQWIDQQRAVCEAATPGPWTCEAWGIEANGVMIAYANTSDEISWSEQDADFVSASRTALPAALDALEASMQREADKDATIARLSVAISDSNKQIAAANAELSKNLSPIGYRAWQRWHIDNAREINALAEQIARLTAEQGEASKKLAIGISPDAEISYRNGWIEGRNSAQKELVDMHENNANLRTLVTRLTAERDAENRRADAAVNDMFDAMAGTPQLCSKCKMNRSNGGPCNSRNDWHNMPYCFKWRGPCTDDAPTGAESEGEHAE